MECGLDSTAARRNLILVPYRKQHHHHPHRSGYTGTLQHGDRWYVAMPGDQNPIGLVRAVKGGFQISIGPGTPIWRPTIFKARTDALRSLHWEHRIAGAVETTAAQRAYSTDG